MEFNEVGVQVQGIDCSTAGASDIQAEKVLLPVVACHIIMSRSRHPCLETASDISLRRASAWASVQRFFRSRGSHTQTSLINSKNIVALIKKSSTGFQ